MIKEIEYYLDWIGHPYADYYLVKIEDESELEKIKQQFPHISGFKKHLSTLIGQKFILAYWEILDGDSGYEGCYFDTYKINELTNVFIEIKETFEKAMEELNAE